MQARSTLAAVQMERSRSPRNRLPLYSAVDARELPFRLHSIDCRAGWDHYRWLRLATYAITFGWLTFAVAASVWMLTLIPD